MKRNKKVNLFVIVILVCSLWTAAGFADGHVRSFTDFGSGTTIELRVGKGTWQINWGQGPWTWFVGEGDSLLGPNVTALLDIHTTAPADISADVVATLPIAGSLTLTAHDPQNRDNVIGKMVLSGSGINVIDLNASRVIVDEGSGMAMTPFPAPEPKMALTLDEATGVFAYIEQVGDWDLHLAGVYAAPLIAGLPLQDNIFAALGGKAPVIGGMATFALSGQYDEEAGRQAESFCAFGKAYATSASSEAGAWVQTWDGVSHDWFTCQIPDGGKLLADDVVGSLETQATAPPMLDEDFILSLPLVGTLTLTDYNDIDPNQIDGQIVADLETVFIADLNAERATIDADGNVVTTFGETIKEKAKPAKVTLRETTGIYADIQQIGRWNFFVNGSFTAMVLPDMPLQQSILAALQNSDLILKAEEDVVLTGWYSQIQD